MSAQTTVVFCPSALTFPIAPRKLLSRSQDLFFSLNLWVTWSLNPNSGRNVVP